MQDLQLLMMIVNREDEESFIGFLSENGVQSVISVLCQGTASQKYLSLMGLEKTGKSLLYSMTQRKKAKRLMARMVSDLGLDMPGNGIALTVPVGSIGGASSLNYFTENQKIIIGEVTEMQENQPVLYELIVVIANRGHVDTVMDAARAAGARGGTVLHAKGTNQGGENRFFGMAIADEKEMLMIVTAAKDKSAIMRSIMERAGVGTPAHAVLFSLPVESVAGLKSVMEAAGENAEE